MTYVGNSRRIKNTIINIARSSVFSLKIFGSVRYVRQKTNADAAKSEEIGSLLFTSNEKVILFTEFRKYIRNNIYLCRNASS